MVDIDHFKSVNDTYGHETAEDIVIRETAQVIKKSNSSVDTIYQWESEKFIVLTPMTKKASPYSKLGDCGCPCLTIFLMPSTVKRSL